MTVEAQRAVVSVTFLDGFVRGLRVRADRLRAEGKHVAALECDATGDALAAAVRVGTFIVELRQ